MGQNSFIRNLKDKEANVTEKKVLFLDIEDTNNTVAAA
jgi:hypothetical protein